MMYLPELKKVTLSDKEAFQKFFATVKEPLADTTFAMRFIWAGPLKHTWAIINDNLCVFGYDKGRYVVWGPPVGGTNLAATLAECFEIVEKLNAAAVNANPAAIYIPEYLKSEYEAVAEKLGCSLDYWTQDYVYRIKDLAELKGPGFDSKRNKANFFMKNYDYGVEEFNFDKHGNECLALVDLWRQQKEDTEDSSADSWRYEIGAETEVARTLIKFSRELGVRGIVLKVEGKVVGVSLGEKLVQNMCSNIIEKTNRAINGASQFIFREFSSYWSRLSRCEFLNAQDDFGVDYLKKVKLSYHPVKLLKSYYLEKK
ncbi:MAG: phosphatidylglycerol lysyltransferase domain-containing protein [Nanoarchaeota archaeon]